MKQSGEHKLTLQVSHQKSWSKKLTCAAICIFSQQSTKSSLQTQTTEARKYFLQMPLNACEVTKVKFTGVGF